MGKRILRDVGGKEGGRDAPEGPAFYHDDSVLEGRGGKWGAYLDGRLADSGKEKKRSSGAGK